MADMKQLYQALIVQHSQEPHNFRELDTCTHRATMSNPLCGDEITVEAQLAGGIIEDISFQGNSCAICTASASMMTRDLKSMELDEAERVAAALFRLLDESGDDVAENVRLIEHAHSELLALAGVRHFPVRLQCAKLPWETFRTAVSGTENLV